MPCDAVRTYDIDLGCTNRKIIDAAIKALGWKIDPYGWVFTQQGNFQITKEGIAKAPQNCMENVNKLRIQCGKEVVNAAAKKFNWKLQNTGPSKVKVSKGGMR